MSELQILDKVGVIVVLFVFVRRLDVQIARFPRFPRLIQIKKRDGADFKKSPEEKSHKWHFHNGGSNNPFFLFGGTFCLSGLATQKPKKEATSRDVDFPHSFSWKRKCPLQMAAAVSFATFVIILLPIVLLHS